VAWPSTAKLGIELASLRLPFRQALDAAAASGVEAVEIDARGMLPPQEISRTGLRELRKMLEDRRLRVAAVSLRTRRGYATPEDLDRRVEATKAAMELAYGLGASVVVNALGRVPPDDAPERRLLREVLDDLGRHGNRVGAILAAETGSESGPELARLLAALPEGCMGVDLNPGRLLAGGFSPLEAVAELGRWICHVHVSDARRGPIAGLGEPVALGQGDADFPALLAALDEHHYRGCFTIQLATADDPQRELAEAIARFRCYAG